MKTLMGYVVSVMYSESGVSRAEREMVAAVVSATNKCQYRTLAHAQALRGEDPESQLAEQLGENYHDAGLPPKQIAMLEFAEFLTTNPSGITEDWVNELRSVGWADEDVIDIVHVAALYNYMCRVADGVGVELQPDRGWEDQAPDLSFQGDTAPKVFATITSAPDTSSRVPGLSQG